MRSPAGYIDMTDRYRVETAGIDGDVSIVSGPAVVIRCVCQGLLLRILEFWLIDFKDRKATVTVTFSLDQG